MLPTQKRLELGDVSGGARELDKAELTTFVLGGVPGFGGILLPESGKELRGSIASRRERPRAGPRVIL